ncbi:hypothetical protein C7E17_26030, partial [Stenotrophomonas maltophilia]
CSLGSQRGITINGAAPAAPADCGQQCHSHALSLPDKATPANAASLRCSLGSQRGITINGAAPAAPADCGQQCHSHALSL